MKRVISFIAVFAMILSCFSSFTAIAQEQENSIAMSSELDSEISKHEIAKVKCHITNSGEPQNASISLYLDGQLIDGGYASFAVAGSQDENFDFMLPTDIDTQYLHTLTVRLDMENGEEVYASCVFKAIDNAPGLALSFSSVPVYATQNYDLYYTLKVSIPSGKVYKGNMKGFINGIEYLEISGEHVLYNGEEINIYVPAVINSAECVKFNLKEEILGVSAESEIDAVNAFTKRFKEVKAIVNPVNIEASITRTTNGYAYPGLSGYVTTIPYATAVTYLNPDNHESMRAAKIRTQSGIVCWVPMSCIYISPKNYTIGDYLTSEEKEIFVNGMGYESKTNYLIWVNKERQILNVFLGKKGEWKLARTFPVATGKNKTPSPTVVCEYQYRTVWNNPGYVCNPVLALYDGYAIHNQPKSHSGYVIDPTMGNPASAGCIRMLQNDVNWVAAYVPVHTTVAIY